MLKERIHTVPFTYIVVVKPREASDNDTKET